MECLSTPSQRPSDEPHLEGSSDLPCQTGVLDGQSWGSTGLSHPRTTMGEASFPTICPLRLPSDSSHSPDFSQILFAHCFALHLLALYFLTFSAWAHFSIFAPNQSHLL